MRKEGKERKKKRKKENEEKKERETKGQRRKCSFFDREVRENVFEIQVE